jgi:hypothetical protein
MKRSQPLVWLLLAMSAACGGGGSSSSADAGRDGGEPASTSTDAGDAAASEVREVAACVRPGGYDRLILRGDVDAQAAAPSCLEATFVTPSQSTTSKVTAPEGWSLERVVLFSSRCAERSDTIQGVPAEATGGTLTFDAVGTSGYPTIVSIHAEFELQEAAGAPQKLRLDADQRVVSPDCNGQMPDP